MLPSSVGLGRLAFHPTLTETVFPVPESSTGASGLLVAAMTDAAPSANDPLSPATATVATVAVAGPAGSIAPLARVMSAAAAVGSTVRPPPATDKVVSMVAHDPSPCWTHSGPAYESTV